MELRGFLHLTSEVKIDCWQAAGHGRAVAKIGQAQVSK